MLKSGGKFISAENLAHNHLHFCNEYCCLICNIFNNMIIHISFHFRLDRTTRYYHPILFPSQQWVSVSGKDCTRHNMTCLITQICVTRPVKLSAHTQNLFTCLRICLTPVPSASPLHFLIQSVLTTRFIYSFAGELGI